MGETAAERYLGEAISELKSAIRPLLDQSDYSEHAEIRKAFNSAAVLWGKALDSRRALAESTMTNPEDIKLRAREVLVNRLRGHALGLAARGRYDPAQSAQITNAEAASYGNLLDEAASMLASLSPERDGEMRERIAREVKRMREAAEAWRRPALRQVEGPNDLKIYGGTIADDIDRWADMLVRGEGDRKAIARIIEPSAFPNIGCTILSEELGKLAEGLGIGSPATKALAKADAILSLLSHTEGKGS